MSNSQKDTQELRERIEDVLLGWSTSNGVVLNTDSKHSLLYGAIPEILALIHQREQAARIDELLVLADTSHLSYSTQRYIDARLTELKGNE
jgi:hypothetical protein